MGKFPGGHLNEMQSFWQRGGGALFAGLCSNLAAMAAKGDARDLLSSPAPPAACQGRGAGGGWGGGRGRGAPKPG